MPTLISHAAVAVAAGVALSPGNVPARFWPLAIVCSVIPDADVIGFHFNIPYGHFFGHRGFFHSPIFALIPSLIIVVGFFHDVRFLSRRWFRYLSFFFMLSASHGILDAFTDGGLGIALLSPFDETRYFFPWTPIKVSPIGMKTFLSTRGLMVMKSELQWILVPSLFMVVISKLIRGLPARRSSTRSSNTTL